MSLTRSVRALALERLRSRHPSATDEELRVRLVVRIYGRELATRVFREIPDDAV
ncbi:MAG: hypothetical protein ACHREM_19790 [Polyangiales bacterium]